MLTQPSNLSVFYIFCLLSLALNSSLASSNTEITLSKANDRQIAELTNRLGRPNVVVGEFEQRRSVAHLNKPLLSSGKFIYWKTQGLYWQTDKPHQQAQTFGKDRNISWSAPGIEDPKPTKRNRQKHFSRILLALFSFDTQQLDDQFDSQWYVSGDHWRLELKPRKKLTRHVIDSASMSGSTHIERLDIFTAKDEQLSIDYLNSVEKQNLSQQQCITLFGLNADNCTRVITAVPKLHVD
jgi:hypothetical protein